MNEWNILPNKLILDATSMSKLIGKYVTKIVYVYGQARHTETHKRNSSGWWQKKYNVQWQARTMAYNNRPEYKTRGYS